LFPQIDFVCAYWTKYKTIVFDTIFSCLEDPCVFVKFEETQSKIEESQPKFEKTQPTVFVCVSTDDLLVATENEHWRKLAATTSTPRAYFLELKKKFFWTDQTGRPRGDIPWDAQVAFELGVPGDTEEYFCLRMYEFFVLFITQGTH
jgi:hypothetical protein